MARDIVPQLLESSAAGFAGFAAELLLERSPETAARFGDSAFRDWKSHLQERIRELAAAMAAGEPRLFASEVAWSRTTFAARDVPLDDLRASLQCLGEVLERELPEAFRPRAGEYLEAALAALGEDHGPPGEALKADSPGGMLALRYLEAALSGDRRRAMDVVSRAVDEGLSVSQAYSRVLVPAQREVGRMWQLHQVGIAQERFVTSTTLALMSWLAQRVSPPRAIGKTVVAVAAPGNVHDLAVRMVADFFDMEGWRSIYLPGEMPADEVALALEAFSADLLALSVTLATQLPAAAATVETARRTRPEVRILVGGRVFDGVPDLWRRLGADAWAADPEEAVRAGARLLGLD